MSERGHLVTGVEALEALVCSCAAFQEATGAADAAAAAAFVYWPGQDPVEEVKGMGLESVETWPAAFADVQYNTSPSLSVPGCVPEQGFRVMIWRKTPADELEDPKAEAKSMLELVGLVMKQMAANSYTAGNAFVSRITMESAGKSAEIESVDYMVASLVMEGLSE